MTEVSPDTASPERPTQRGALWGFVAFCVATAVANIATLVPVRDGSGLDSGPYVALGLQAGIATLYAWIWVSVVLVWSARDDLWSMLNEAGPSAETRVPSSGVAVGWRLLAYVGALGGSVLVVSLRDGIGPSDAAEVLGIVAFGQVVGLLAGAVAAGMVTYPVVLLVRASRTAPLAGADPGVVRQTRQARAALVSLALLLLAVFPFAVVAVLAYGSAPTEGEDAVRAFFGESPEGLEIARPPLLWVARVLLAAMAVLLVWFVFAKVSLNSVLTRERSDRRALGGERQDS